MVFDGARIVLVAVALALAFAVSLARAEPTPADKETARSLLNEGDRKLKANDLEGALASYRAADAIMSVPTTAIEVAKTEEKLGRLVEARDTALRITRAPQDRSEPRAFRLARAAAERLAAELSQRIPSIQVKVVGPPAGAVTIEVDGEALPPAAASMPRKVNPGRHALAARAPGFERATGEVAVSERETRDYVLTLDRSKNIAPAASLSIPPNAAPNVDSRLSSVGPQATARGPLFYVGTALGAAGLVVGTATGISELGHAAHARDAGDRESWQAELDTAHRLATISNISFAIGAVGVATAIFALVRPGHASDDAAKRASLELLVGPGAAGVAGTF